MSLKYNWIDRQNGVDDVDAEDINKVAHAVIEVEERLDEAGEGAGSTFFPAVSENGIISWTNDGGLPNPTPVNIKGPQGPTGKTAYQYAKDDGYTGSEAEYREDINPDKIKAEVRAELSQVETPKIVSSEEEMTDTSKHYVLNGNIWASRTTTREGETVLVPNFTNLIKFDASGNPTNVELNKRYSGSAGAAAGYLSAQNGSFAITDLVGGAGLGTVYINQKPVGQSKAAHFVSETTAEVNSVDTINTGDWVNGENGEYKANLTADVPFVKFSAQMSTSAITADNIKGLIVTINEPISYTEQKAEDVTVEEWYDTGISYAPTFKTDLVGVLGEGNVVYLSDNLPSGTYTLKYPDNDYATVGTITK